MPATPSTRRAENRLIIHTGDHKTGTTTIQESLARGDVTLRGGRLIYPLGAGQFNHNGLFQSQKRKAFARGSSVPVGKAFAAFAQGWPRAAGDVAVMSAEQLEAVRPADLARALKRHGLPSEGDALVIVTYLRPHIPRVTSQLAEWIKIGWAAPNPWPLVEIRARRRLRYAMRMTAWRDVFGPAHILRPAIRAELAGGDALEDFVATALGPGVARIAPAPASNTSIGLEDLMRLHVIHQALPELGRQAHHVLGWHLAQELDTLRASGGPKTPLRAHKGLATRLRRAFRADAGKIDTGWLGGRALFRAALDEAVETALPKRQPLRPEAWLEAGEIAELRARAPEFRALVTGSNWRARLQARRLAQIAPAPDTPR